MSEAEQSRDTAKDPRRDAAAGAVTDGDRGVVPAAREPERDDATDTQDAKNAQVERGAEDAGASASSAGAPADAAAPADPARPTGPADQAGATGSDVGDVKDVQDAPGGPDVKDAQSASGGRLRGTEPSTGRAGFGAGDGDGESDRPPGRSSARGTGGDRGRKASANEGRLLAGRYRLGGVLGRGGMGTVWRAVDETLGRTVAVKELRFPTSIDDDEKRRLITRTLREAKAIARIRNNGAVTVYDVVDEDDRPWIVMELIEGKSLAVAGRGGGT
ncbi:serine/threonine protein kinase, partial [Streptomyces sp. NPDC059556]